MSRFRRIRALLAAALAIVPAAVWAQDAVRPSPLKSGIEFTGAEVRALQNDEFEIGRAHV